VSSATLRRRDLVTTSGRAPTWVGTAHQRELPALAAAGRESARYGESPRRESRRVDARDQLSPQEAQIARDGLSGPDIRTRLLISRATVEYHLTRVFAKRDIRPRPQLHHALRDEPAAARAA
jgi:DNA-binding NarL/FixJ family response regulator